MTRAVLAAIIATAGCGSDAGSSAVLRVHLTVDESSCGTAPELITFPCQGRVGVWLLDEFDQTSEEFCVGMPEGTPLPGLDNVLEANDVSFTGLEIGDSVALELAVFNDNVPFCDRPFGGGGIDPPDPEPLPAAESIFLSGRSNLVTLDSTTEIIVPLECGVVDEQCDAVFTAFTDVVDVETLFIQSIPDIVERAQFGFVLDGQFVSLSDMAFDDLSFQFSAKLAEPPPADAQCVGAVVTSAFSQFDLLSCDGFADRDFANVIAYTLDEELLFRLENGSPTDPVGDDNGGVLLGKVVNESNEPVAGAQVDSPFGGTITYPNLEVDGTASLGSTGKEGYFLMSGPGSECCQELEVFDVNNGSSGGLSFPTGTVEGLMTITVISTVPGGQVDPEPDPNGPTPAESGASSSFAGR